MTQQQENKIQLPLELIKVVSDELYDEYELRYRESRVLLEKVAEALELHLQEVLIKDENPNWYEKMFNNELKMADSRGYRRALRKVISILTVQPDRG